MRWNRRTAQRRAVASRASIHFAAFANLHMFAVVLVHPEIPPNTGNVIRLTANSGTDLHLVEPLGFRMDDKALKRAGLDYHEYARVRVHADYAACRRALDATPRRPFAFTTHAAQSLADVRFDAGDVLVFGSETRGLPPAVLATFDAAFRVRIPMRAGIRSINLSNAVAVAVYEAWRQHGYAGAG
jgi:tRNA (cytidine/uridine-2'-O-)-methyltransferase